MRPEGGAARGGLVATPAQLGISARRPGMLLVIHLTGAGEARDRLGLGAWGGLGTLSPASGVSAVSLLADAGPAGRNPRGGARI